MTALDTTPAAAGPEIADQPTPADADDADTRRVGAVLTELRAHLQADRATNIGFPSTFDFDYRPLWPFFNNVLNNVGDPFTDSAFPANTKHLEREVIEFFARILRAPEDDYWGYVTTGGTEGTEYGLLLARTLLPDALTYVSASSHPIDRTKAGHVRVSEMKSRWWLVPSTQLLTGKGCVMVEQTIRDVASIELPAWGGVVGVDGVVPFRVVDPAGRPVEPIERFLRDFVARGNSSGSVRSYAFGLHRWWRFLRAVDLAWDQATSAEVRDFVLWLRQARKAGAPVRRASARLSGTVNPITRKRYLDENYKVATVRHSNAVVRTFYEFWVELGVGPLVNPVPLDRPRGRRPNEHHNPMQPMRAEGRLRYNPVLPRRRVRAMPDERWNDLFTAMRSHRDRAILALAVSTAARASELLGLRGCDLDWGDQLIRVRRKGTGAEQWLPASAEAPEVRRVGPVDGLDADAIVALLPQLPTWHGAVKIRGADPRLRAARAILDWLSEFAGQGWQERWVNSGADQGEGWLDSIVVSGLTTPKSRRASLTGGLLGLLLCRAVLPSYEFLVAYRAYSLYQYVRRVFDPELFTRLERAGVDAGMRAYHVNNGLNAIAKMVLHTGRGPGSLMAADVHRFRAVGLQRKTAAKRMPTPGAHSAWDMLHAVGIITGEKHLFEDVRRGQRPAAELVDDYGIQCGPIRDLIIRYLEERRPAVDYTTFRGLAATLAGRFWADIERHHPGVDSLSLPGEVVTAWKQRLSVVTGPDGEQRPRADYIERLLVVRGFYLDIAQWALEDPFWVPWAVPCPIRRSETAGIYRQRQKVTARMHQRVRERLPLLPALVDEAHRHLADRAALLAAACSVDVGEHFEHDGHRYQRVAARSAGWYRPVASVRTLNLSTGQQQDVGVEEDHAFWAWAVIETLRHTGVRMEELLELTQLALVSYRLADTGEVVPLLQIVPSKSDEERLLLVSPELASVLASVISRLRAANDGVVPLVARYDEHERVTGPPLPHLFQRKAGWRNQVINGGTVINMLNDTLARADLRDPAGQPLSFTAHDFRRMFATEAVTGGLPVHIAARILGHHNLATTQAYLAVFQDDLIRTYRAFLDQRRALRPQADYREPTDEEWQEFQQHFELRKLELGTCGRPYGTPCKHEHACLTELILKPVGALRGPWRNRASR